MMEAITLHDCIMRAGLAKWVPCAKAVEGWAHDAFSPKHHNDMQASRKCANPVCLPLASTCTLCMALEGTQRRDFSLSRHVLRAWKSTLQLAVSPRWLNQFGCRFFGHEVGTEGDSFTMAFHDPLDATAWCTATQQVRSIDLCAYVGPYDVVRGSSANLNDLYSVHRPGTGPDACVCML